MTLEPKVRRETVCTPLRGNALEHREVSPYILVNRCFLWSCASEEGQGGRSGHQLRAELVNETGEMPPSSVHLRWASLD